MCGRQNRAQRYQSFEDFQFENALNEFLCIARTTHILLECNGTQLKRKLKNQI